MVDNSVAVESIITEFVVRGTDEAISKAKKFSDNVEAVKAKLIAMQKETGQPFKVLAEGLKQDAQAIDKIGIATSQVSKITNTAVSQLTQSANQSTSAFSKMGQAIQYAFGLGLYQIINRITDAMRNGIKTAIEYGQALTMLAVSTRALQRTGSTITFKEVIQEVKDLKALFPIFTTMEAAQAVGFTQLVTRNFQFTNEEMLKTLKIASGLSVLLGKDLQVASRELALFLSSGYAESMQRAGFAVNRLTVVEEAHRMGINKSYMAMTEVERSHAALSLIYRQFETVQEDVNAVMDQQYYKLEIAKKSWEEFTNTLSLRFLPVLAFISDGIKTLVGLLAVFTNSTIAAYNAIGKEYELFKEKFANPEEFLKGQKKIFSEMASEMVLATKSFFGENQINLPLGNYFGDITLSAEETESKVLDIISQMYSDLKKSEQQYINDSNRLWVDYDRDGEKMFQDHARKILDLSFAYYDDLAKMEREYKQDQADKTLSHNEKLDKIDRDNIYDLNELAIKYTEDRTKIFAEGIENETERANKARERELKEERDYQEKLLKLREGFELDLEDAVRERDARQIMQLSRRYALQQKQLEREHGNNLIDIRTTNEKELQEIIDQRARKLQLLAEEFASRQAEIERNRQREIDEENIRFGLELADLRRSYDEKRAERKIQWDLDKEELAREFERQKTDRANQYKDDLADLKQSNIDRYNEIVASLLEQNNATASGLDLIAKNYEATYGKDGRVDKAMQYYFQLMELAASVGGGTSFAPFSNITPTGPISGGEGFFNVPPTGPISTMPDVFSVPNTSGLFSSNQVGSSFANPITSEQQNVVIEVDLSPDLVARIQQETLNQVAEVLVRTGRRNAR